MNEPIILDGEPIEVVVDIDCPPDTLYIMPSRQSIDIADAPTTGEVPE